MMVQMNSPGSGWTNGLFMDRLLLQQHDQQHEHFGENRHAFEQEEREVHGARDLVGRAGLPRDTFGGRRRQLTDAETRADDDHAEANRGTEVMQNLTPFLYPPLVETEPRQPKLELSDEREWPCR